MTAAKSPVRVAALADLHYCKTSHGLIPSLRGDVNELRAANSIRPRHIMVAPPPVERDRTEGHITPVAWAGEERRKRT